MATSTYTVNSINELNQSVTGDSLLTGISNPLAVNDNLLTGGLSTSISSSSSLPIIENGNNSNSTTVIKSNPFAIVGNVVVGNGQWITSNETTPESVSLALTSAVDQLLDSVIVKLRNRLPLSDAGSGLSDSNPFANGNNPFGDGNQPSAPGLVLNASGENLVVGSENPFESGEIPVTGGENPFTSGENPFASSENPVVSGENPFTSGENPFIGGENPFASGENPFASGENPFASGGANQQPSFDISQFIFGNDDNLTFLTGDGSVPELSSSEILKTIQADILTVTKILNSGNLFADGNNTPLQTPSDLLRLFRNDIFSFNSGVNAVNELATGDTSYTDGSNPFLSLFAGGSQDQEIPFDILNVALEGILPFNGKDNVFSTPDGELPIGYGNRDFGTDNATIGNANWDYGNGNATIGNGNWLWDSSTDNATIGNGNWNLDASHDNTTIGNGNWYWNSTSDNTTLGNGNWSFGNNNTTLGNGNFDFGSNNTVIGSGNNVFTSNSIVIGNGNWSVVIDKSSAGASDFLTELNTWVSVIGVKDATDNLIDSVIGKLGEAFVPLAGNLSASGTDTFNRLFLS
ncbi:hypothetical protein H6G81_14175 [Scytonema hofmannii FACHB-248]|uniref:Uncharacterized protein n=1 Tax=Scytonema hofmannii FACHB-248 TaxID=1842502 RepID=A0ABR8GQE2_9CYAN|nr:MULTISPECIES: hypothetical protein [Nostocales]MBD2605644.1 hypothetical protein [Scytonema hofmannii FACHB-248]